MRHVGGRLAWLAIGVLAVAPRVGLAQEPVGVFTYTRRVQDGVDRSHVATGAVGTTLPGVPSLFWRCGEAARAGRRPEPTIELALLVDGVTAEGGLVSVQWRFDSDAPAAATTWVVAGSGIAIFAPDTERDVFTERARSARSVTLRIRDAHDGYDSRFALDGLSDALARLECEDALRDPDAPPVENPVDAFVEQLMNMPFTQAPRLLNGEAAAESIARAYPPDLRDSRIGGVVRVYVLVDERGRVQETRIDETSGWLELDDAALAVARRLEFFPARNGNETVAAWVSFPITFRVR
jgi:TonB family protein